LLASLAAMRPVRTRAPVRSLLLVAFVACAYPVWTLAASAGRPAVGAVSLAWFGGVAALWFAGFLIPLSLALVPARGQVVPDGGRAFRAALVIGVALFCVSLIGGEGGRPVALTSSSWHDCLLRGLKLGAPTIVAGALALRRLLLVDSWRLGAALGAAGGSLAGLTLHLTCARTSPSHVALAHAGGLALAALLGTLAVPSLVHSKR